MNFTTVGLRDRRIIKELLLITLFIGVTFVTRAQTPTSIVMEGGSPQTYIYVGSLTQNTTNSGNCQKLKVNVFGGSWLSNTDGETTFYIGNRNGLSINEVTTGSSTINGFFTLHAYQNGNQTDFYFVCPANSISTLAVLSYWYAGEPSVGTSKFMTITSSTAVPVGTEITPLTIIPVMTTDASGNIGVNTPNTSASYKFAINGGLIATSATVKLYANWPDYVFKPEYKLPSLKEVKRYIDQNHHLSEMPSAPEVEKDGLNLGETNKLLTKKVEELTLYLIQQNKQLVDQKQMIEVLQNQMESLSKEVKK